MSIAPHLRSLFAFLLVLLPWIGINAQLELPEHKVKVTFSVEQDGADATIIAHVKVDKGWHINATVLPTGSFGIPTEFNLTSQKKFKTVGGVIEPKPKNVYDEEAGEHLSYHEGSFQMKRKIKVLSKKDFTISGGFYFQTCNEVTCLPDYTYDFTVNVKGFADADEAAAIAIDEPTKDNPITETAATSLSDKQEEAVANPVQTDEPVSKKTNWTIFFLAFGSGILALLTPCVFPMIPMTVSFFTKGGKDRKKGLRDAIIYGLCIIFIYTAIGVIVKATGTGDYINAISTNPVLNVIFFAIFFVFALSFLGAFEIRMPSKLVNKADAKADKGGFIGIFFMALVLVLVSFSCTGPILGSLLISASTDGGNAVVAGMFGFGLALGLPFAIFAAFPGMMESLPKSGGWLNTVKVVLGLFELAFAFKFLSNADMALQLHLLEREVFIAIWIAIFGALALNLYGILLFPHDSKPERIGVGRAVFGMFVSAFVFYLILGLFGHPMKIISAFPPPLHYSEAPQGPFSGVSGAPQGEHIEGTHLGPQGIYVFDDYDKALAYAKQVNKPLFVDFTGHNCVNCRKMEMDVWGRPGIIDMLRNDYVIVSLHVDERKPLPENEQAEVIYPDGSKRQVKTVGQKWTAMQVTKYNIASQPYYRVVDTDGNDINEIGAASYETHRNADKFKDWLEKGLSLGKKK